MDPVTIGGYVLAVLVGLLAFRMKRGDIWKDEAEAQKARADRLEGEMLTFRAEFEAYRTTTNERVNKLEIENSGLRELATSREYVIAMSDQMNANHIATMKILERIAINGQVIATQGGIHHAAAISIESTQE